MIKSLCDKCKHKRKVWSDGLAEKGYNGCYGGSIELTTQEQSKNVMEASIVAFGWVESSIGYHNNKLVVKGVKKCKMFEKKGKEK